MEPHDDVNLDKPVQEGRPASSSKEATPPDENSEVRVPRKREREVSLEPQTPQASSSELEPHTADTKDRRAPAKKNRVSAQLDSTREEEEQNGNGDTTPTSSGEQGVSGSPPTESKIRQISQGVEDITWKNMPRPATPDIERTEPDAQHAPMDTDQGTGAAEEPTVPQLMRGGNPPLVIDEAGEDEHAGVADPAEVPAEAQPEDAAVAPNDEHEEATPPPDHFMQPPEQDTTSLSRQVSDENIGQEKTLKRKMGDRTVSERQVPEDLLEAQPDAKLATTTKRPRDDDTDANPRETKRPTPPPDEELNEDKPKAGPSSVSGRQTPPNATSQTQPSTPKFGGFMSYASTSSPFASVKGPSLFSSKPSGSSSGATPMAVSPAPTRLGSSSLLNAPGSPSSHSSLKRSGFEAFASSSSPFASAAKRSKSPPPSSLFGRRSGSPARHHSPARVGVNPFSAYATGSAHGFTTPSQKSSASGSGLGGVGSVVLSENGAEPETSASTQQTQNGDAEEDESATTEKEVSFAERLRSQKEEDDADPEEDEKKLNLTELEVETGEEDEETVYQVRGKLFALSPQNQWRERGTGQLKLNVRQDDGGGARLLMRKEAVYTLLLNATLFKGMKCAIGQDPRYIRFSVFENGVATHYNLRVSNAKIASELLEEINAHIP